ncbi:MAG: stage III sporulation protein AE [Hespellia sp.]|nr:stage III sporulation protein AE [Hespellia sp.]
MNEKNISSGGKKIMFYVILGMFLWSQGITVQAQSISGQPEQQTSIESEEERARTQSQYESALLEKLHISDIEKLLNQMYPGQKMSFGTLVKQLLSGDTKSSGQLLQEFFTDQLFYTLKYHKKILIQLILIALVSAVFKSFLDAFQNKQLSETCFYVIYLLLLTLCLHSFQDLVEALGTNLDHLIEFMRVLCPSFFISVAIAAGASSSLIFYNIVLFIIYAVETVAVGVLLPVVHVYIMILFLNYLAEESYLTQMAELIDKSVSWLLKGMVALVVGMNVIQGMLSPVLDSLKRGTLTRTASSIPVVGDVLGNTTELFLGTAVLLKNSIGIAGMLIIVFICIGPLLQIAIVVFLYKAAAAFVQPIADKRIVGCIGSMSEGCMMLLKIYITMTLLFLLTITIIVSSTSVIH